MNRRVKNYTAVELLEQLMAGNQSTTMIIVSRAAIQAIIKQLQKEQNLTQEVANDIRK